MLSILIFFLYFFSCNAYVKKRYTYIVFHCTQVHISKQFVAYLYVCKVSNMYNIHICGWALGRLHTSILWERVHVYLLQICNFPSSFFLSLKRVCFVNHSSYIFLQIKLTLLMVFFTYNFHKNLRGTMHSAQLRCQNCLQKWFTKLARLPIYLSFSIFSSLSILP